MKHFTLYLFVVSDTIKAEDAMRGYIPTRCFPIGPELNEEHTGFTIQRDGYNILKKPTLIHVQMNFEDQVHSICLRKLSYIRVKRVERTTPKPS